MSRVDRARQSGNVTFKAYVVLVLLTVLFAIDGVVSFPSKTSVDLSSMTPETINLEKRDWYTLDSDDYSIDGFLCSVNRRSSSRRFSRTVQYNYYCVTVNPNTEQSFSLAVRVKDKDAEAIASGANAELYGMISTMPDEIRYDAADMSKSDKVCFICLNDNGDTVELRYIKSSAFFMLMLLCIIAICKLYKKSK